MNTYQKEFIEFLIDANVLKFGSFIAKSGRHLPYFINAGEIKTGAQINKLGEFYAKCYAEKLGDAKTVLYGPAYKGIPLAVSTVRKKRITAKAAYSSATSPKQAKKLSSSKTLSQQAPRSAKALPTWQALTVSRSKPLSSW